MDSGSGIFCENDNRRYKKHNIENKKKIKRRNESNGKTLF